MKECIKKNLGTLFFTILFSFASSIGMAVGSLFLQSIIDCAVNEDMSAFKRILLYTIIYVVLLGAVSYIYNILSKIFMRNVTKTFRNKIFSGVIRRNYEDFTSVNTGDYISALSNDIKLIEDNYIVPLLSLFEYAILFISTLVILLWISPLITGFLFISTLLVLFVPNLLGKVLQDKQKALSNKLVEFTNKIKDMFLGYDVIRSYNLKGKIIKEFTEENNSLSNTKFISDKYIAINETLSSILGFSTQTATMFLAAYFVIKGDISVGMLIAVIQLSGTFIQPVIMIISNIPKIKGIKPVLDRLEGYSSYKDKGFQGKDVPKFNNTIEADNLTFGYDKKKTIINGLNLKLEKNKKYAIVGNSGCGKSTLVKLLVGYYSKYTGDIKFDGKNIRSLDIDKLNEMISIIHQDVYMFDKSIKDNICLYKNFSEKDINEVLRLSGVSKFINELEDGLNYRIGENGSNLSGGQKQRIAIARALIQKTPILVLDEGTSAIDMQTGYDIESKLLGIKDLTLITITHKMSKELLGLYDEIIYIENGEIEEKGDFHELYEKEGNFSRFYTLETK